MIELDGFPELVDPLLIAAFEGWNDAGDAATSAVEHLEEVWEAVPLTELDPEDYYDYQVNRPTVSQGDDGRRLVTWPTTRVSYARLPDLGRDVVLDPRHRAEHALAASSPSEILGVCHELGVEMVVTLGALLADSPHTRPVPVTGTSSDEGADPLAAPRAVPLRGPDRHRRDRAGRLHPRRRARAVDLGGGPPLRRPAALPQGDPRPAAPHRGPARRADPARRPARGRPGLGARRRRAGRRGPRGRRLRPLARGGQGPHRGAGGLRRRDRPRVRALPAPARGRQPAADGTCLIPVWSGYDRSGPPASRRSCASASRWATSARAARWRARPSSAAATASAG